MAVRGVNPHQPLLPPSPTGPAKPSGGADPFQAVLDQASADWEPAKPSSPLAKMQLEMVKSLVQMELLNLNTTLMSALGGGSSGGGGGIVPGDSGMSGLISLVKLLQMPDQGAEDSQKTAAGPDRTSKRRSVKSGAAAEPDLEEEDVSGGKPSLVPLDLGPGAPVDDIINQTALAHGLDPSLVKAVVRTESNFNPKAVSHAGAMGLMQLMPATARDLGVENPFDPVENVSGGTRYLKQMLERYAGDISQALAAYNWGPGNLDRNQNSGFMPEETRNYIRIVTDYYRRYQAEKGA